MIQRYICGLCPKWKERKGFIGTRKGLRKHLREEHRIMTEIANVETAKGRFKQNWWITEECSIN